MPEAQEPKGFSRDDEERVDTRADIEKIVSELMDSPGYVLFAAHIDPVQKEGQKTMINFSYKRHQFSFEDTRKAIDEFMKHFRRDVESL